MSRAKYMEGGAHPSPSAAFLATFINRAIEVTAGSANPVTRAARKAGKTPFGIPASLLFLHDVVNSRESESTQFIPAVKTIFSPLKSVNLFTDFTSDFVCYLCLDLV